MEAVVCLLDTSDWRLSPVSLLVDAGKLASTTRPRPEDDLFFHCSLLLCRWLPMSSSWLLCRRAIVSKWLGWDSCRLGGWGDDVELGLLAGTSTRFVLALVGLLLSVKRSTSEAVGLGVWLRWEFGFPLILFLPLPFALSLRISCIDPFPFSFPFSSTITLGCMEERLEEGCNALGVGWSPFSVFAMGHTRGATSCDVLQALPRLVLHES